MSNAGHKEIVEVGFWTVNDVAAYLNVKSSTIYGWGKTGEIPHYKIGKMVRFKKEDIETWMEKHRKEEIDTDKKARGILKAINRPVADITSIVKKSIAEVKGNGYTPSHGKPDQIKGLRKEVSSGTL
jgi:excisionase family DNA binding protein